MDEEEYKFKYRKIEQVWYILFTLSEVAFSMPNLCIGKLGGYYEAGEAVQSMMKTLENIDFCCRRNSYSDAYVFLRKYRDDFMLYHFLVHVIKNRKEDTSETFDWERLFNSPDELLEIIERGIAELLDGKHKNEDALAMESWMYNTLEEDTNHTIRKRYYGASKYKKYLIENSEDVAYIFKAYFEEKWKNIDRLLYNYVHVNGIRYMTDNYVRVDSINQKAKDNKLIDIFLQLTDIFLVLLAVVDSTRMQDLNYLEAIEVGMNIPVEACYSVNKLVLGYMDERIDIQLISYLQENDKNGMQFVI